MAELLLVDNDTRITELLAWFLERRGHRVRCAASYREAREMMAAVRPDLLLADLELGDERGETELPRLEREGLLPPTLVVSGYLDQRIEADLRTLEGVRGTVSKPFDLEQLEGRVAAVLAELGAGEGAGEAREGVLRPAPGPGATSLNVRLPEPGPDPGAPGGTAAAAEADDEGWVEIGPSGPVGGPGAGDSGGGSGRDPGQGS